MYMHETGDSMSMTEIRKAGAIAHREKFEALAQRFGVDRLIPLVPFTRERIEKALVDGDEHLNTLSMTISRTWSQRRIPGDVCGGVCWDQTYGMTHHIARTLGIAGGWSLSDNTCLMKHVAKYHIAGK